MNREIKFRVWDYKAAHYVIPWSGNEYDDIDLIYSNDGCWYWLGGSKIKEQDAALEQYTGLKDKNGKEVYEGDFVECDNNMGLGVYDKIYGIVCFDEEYGSFRVAFSDIVARTFYQIKGELEVIGNIRENPELV